MALTFPARSYAGAASAGTLAAAISSGSTTFTSSTTLTGWVDITGGTFTGRCVIAFGYGTAAEEKMLCTYSTSTGNFTIITRGYDGTTSPAGGWPVATTFNLVWSANEAAEANAAVQNTIAQITSAGDMLYGTGSRTMLRLPIGSTGQALVSNGSTPYWSSIVGTQGAQGANGAQGAQGANGTNGTQGAQGAQGAQGPQGGGGGGGGAISNQAWAANGTNVAVISGGTLSGMSGINVTATGFTTYLITFTSVIRNNDTVTRTASGQIYTPTGNLNGVSSFVIGAGGYATFATHAIYTASPGTSYFIAPVMTISGSTNGTATVADFSVVGIA